jgi:hypothetical protein
VDNEDVLRKTVEKLSVRIERLGAAAARREWRELLGAISEPQRLEHWGRKVYSQNDEDGIVGEIVSRVGLTPASGLLIEIGASTGLENNTHLLLRQGFRTHWVEGSEESIDKMRKAFASYISSGRLVFEHAFVTAENVDALVSSAADGPVALLSIDVDGNDYWLWKAVTTVTPAIVIIEYNGKFPPPLSIAQRYNPRRVWKGTDAFGASLAAMEKLGREKGYRLVGCNITGSNAFFVRQDLVADHFPYEHTAAHLYQPCRYYLTYDCFASAGFKSDVGDFVAV